MYLCLKNFRRACIDHRHFSDSVRWVSGVLFRGSLWHVRLWCSVVYSATPELHKIVPGSLSEADLTDHTICIPTITDLTPVIPRLKGKKLMSRATCSYFGDSTHLVQSWSTLLYFQISARWYIFWSPPFLTCFFYCSVMSEARNWAEEGKQKSSNSWFCSFHYSSHCLESNCKEALFFWQGRN